MGKLNSPGTVPFLLFLCLFLNLQRAANCNETHEEIELGSNLTVSMLIYKPFAYATTYWLAVSVLLVFISQQTLM